MQGCRPQARFTNTVLTAELSQIFSTGVTFFASTIFDISIEEQDGILRIRYHGDGFLYNMVRILTGTLIEVGTGNRAPFQIPMILDGLDRSLAGFTAPPNALFLVDVFYPDTVPEV